MLNRQEVEGLKIRSYKNMCGQRKNFIYLQKNFK